MAIELLFGASHTGKNPHWGLAAGVRSAVADLETEMDGIRADMEDADDPSSPVFMLRTQEATAKYTTLLQYMSQLLAASKSLCESLVRNI